MKPGLGALAALVLASVAGSAMAEGPTSLAVRIGGDEVRMPLPKGYCEPAGRYANIAQLTDAMDSQNVTYLAVVDCEALATGGTLSRYLFLRAPKVFAAERLTRAQLFERMGPVPDDPQNAMLDNPDADKVMQDMQRATGRRIEVGGDLRPVAKDDFGYYMAGTLKAEMAGQSRQTSVGIGATTAKGHVVTVNVYVRGADLAAVREALRIARATTKGVAEANP